MRKHTRCCSLQTITANPYSRGTSPQTVPNSSTKGTRPVWPNFPTNGLVHAHWFLGSRSQTSSLKEKDRDLDRAHAMTHYHHMFNKTDTACCQIKMGMVAYLIGGHHMFNKTDTTCNMSMWVWWRTWVPDVVIIFLCIASITSNIYRNNAT